MRRHLENEHGLAFQLHRDVHFAGNEIRDPKLTYSPATPAHGARFWCERCAGAVFTLGPPPYGDRERNALLRRTDPGLQGALSSVPPEDTEAFTEAWDRNQIGVAQLHEVGRRERMRTSRRRPEAQLRQDNAARYLLAAYERLGRVEGAIDDLLELQRRDPKRYREILGTDRPYAYETVRTWWRKIPAEEREKAKVRHRERASAA